VLEIVQIQLVLNDIIGYGIMPLKHFFYVLKIFFKKIIYFYFHIILMLDTENKILKIKLF